MRSKGISTLIACQNEEATVGWCILSFLDFSDEIIVVDNGSTDASKEICREMARRYPEKVSFHDVPHLKDLYENRQYAFERSHYNWIVRADADYICYTDGEYDCRKFRNQLLNGPSLPRPYIYRMFRPNLAGDFWHTGRYHPGNDGNGADPKGVVVSDYQDRVYRVYPGFRFGRKGRWEGLVQGRLARKLTIRVDWPVPLWMHCDIKSDLNFLYRSERTNWRELGDFQRFPTLKSYLQNVVPEKYGTDDLELAASRYVSRSILPAVMPYRPEEAYPYPTLVRQAMQDSPVYRIVEESTGIHREYHRPVLSQLAESHI